MNKQQFEDKVRLIILEQGGVDLCDVKMDSYLDDDLGADSLDAIELVMALEEEFATEITDEEVENCGYRVDNICYHLAEKLGYAFYKEDVPHKSSVDAPEEYYMTDTSKHTPVKENTAPLHTESFIDEMELAFSRVKHFAEENKFLLSFDPSGKVTLIQQEDEFVVDNYRQVKQVVDALKVLDGFRI